MRSALLITALLLTACTPSQPPPDAALEDAAEFDPTAAQMEDLDDRVRALRLRLDRTDVHGDVLAQAFELHVRALERLEDRAQELDDRADGAEVVAEDTVDRIDQLESAPAGLRRVDLDPAGCLIATDDGGLQYRLAPQVRAEELLLHAAEDASLRVEVPVAVTCGVTSEDSGFDVRTAAVVDAGSVYLAPGAAAWFRVAR